MAQVLRQPGWGLSSSTPSWLGGILSIIPRAVCLRHSREDWCVYVERKHRDHIRGRDPRCCRVQSLARAVMLLQEKVGRAGL